MSKGVPLPLAAAMIFVTSVLSGAGGYYLARERGKPPAAGDIARPPNPAMSEATKAALPRPVQTASTATAPNKPEPTKRAAARPTEPEKVTPPVPTLEDVLKEAERLARSQAENEPAATAMRIKDEVDFLKRIGMQNVDRVFRTEGSLPFAMKNEVLRHGLFELHNRVSLQNKRNQSNPSFVTMTTNHYDLSIKSANLTLDQEANWVLRAWTVVGFTLIESDVTEACNEASRYFKFGQVGDLRGRESIALYKALTGRP